MRCQAISLPTPVSSRGSGRVRCLACALWPGFRRGRPDSRAPPHLRWAGVVGRAAARHQRCTLRCPRRVRSRSTRPHRDRLCSRWHGRWFSSHEADDPCRTFSPTRTAPSDGQRGEGVAHGVRRVGPSSGAGCTRYADGIRCPLHGFGDRNVPIRAATSKPLGLVSQGVAARVEVIVGRSYVGRAVTRSL